MGRVWGLVVRPAVLVLAVVFPVAGCSNVCPAIGWVNTVTVELDGDVSRVSSVQLCLIEKQAGLRWKRAGGSAQCGGPSEALPIRITVPAV